LKIEVVTHEGTWGTCGHWLAAGAYLG
jgi:hypothetical protein